MARTKKMTKEMFADWAIQHGWKQSSWGHLHKGEFRFKMQVHTVRLERGYRIPATKYSKSEKRWVRRRTGRFRKMFITEDGKLGGMD